MFLNRKRMVVSTSGTASSDPFVDSRLDYKYCNNSIKLGGGGLIKTGPAKKGAYSKGGRIEKSGKYVAKGPKKRFEVLKMDWIKWLLS